MIQGMMYMKTYLKHRIVNVIDIKELIALEYLDFKGKYKDYSESHDFWELCFVEKGRLTLISDGKEIMLKKGQMILTSPGRQHSYHQKDTECSAYVICFESQSQSLRALADESFTPEIGQISCIKIIIEEAKNTFETDKSDQLQIIQNPNFGGGQAIISQLEYLLICTLRQVSSMKNSNVIFISDNNFYAGITQVILEYFRQNIREKLNLDKICRKINYSRSFLCKTFKEQTGETLIACFNRMKTEEAMRLLRGTSYSVAQIAQDLGFSDPKYFNTIFKKQTGFTPAVYRKKAKEGLI